MGGRRVVMSQEEMKNVVMMKRDREIYMDIGRDREREKKKKVSVS
jgi:hypothetical protein